MERKTDMTKIHTIRFGEWIAQNYEPCGETNWKKRYPKTSEEMTECFTTEEIYFEYSLSYFQ
jgi:hypothetical protein